MGHNKYLSKAMKKLIVQASNNGKTVRQILIDMNIPQSTVGYTLKVFQHHFQVSSESLPSFNKVRTPEINNFSPR